MQVKEFNSEIRGKIAYVFLIGVFVFFLFRLYQLQIIDFETYQKLSKRNAIKEKIIEPYRGVFYDRNWNLLVDNKPSYTLRITPKTFDTLLIPILESYFKFESGTIRNKLLLNRFYSPFIPIKILRGLTFEQISWLEENSKSLSGVDYSIDMERTYVAGVRGSHLFGYCKEISEKKLKESFGEYLPGDFVGHTGIERYYEDILKGQKGKQLLFVDSKGREVGLVNDGKDDIPAKMGYSLQLTIDLELQKKAEELMEGKTGAVVALDPNNGEVLAMVSKPDFDLSYFSSITPIYIWRQLNTDKKKPLFNRATSSYYPPGSTFKMMSAVAALQEGVITDKTLISCPGGFLFGNRFFKCHGGHGGIDVIHAIEKSCNTFFYSLILKEGFDTWSKYGELFGFGKKTGIDIYEESAGLLPNEEYYDKVYGKNRWTKGFLVSLGIGQGEVGTTPLQLAVYAATLGNGGVRYVPHIVRKYFNNLTKEEKWIKIEGKDLGIRKDVINTIRKGMYLVVNGAGTASNARIPGIEVAGKTGTAQNPHGQDHAWFIAFAPYENPKIAIAVIVENVGFGATHAAPIARELIQTYLKPKNDNIKIKESPDTTGR